MNEESQLLDLKMKTNWQTKKLGEVKKPIQPNWEETEFAKTIDGQIMVMLNEATKNKHFIEAQALSWTTIEQILLPRLIGWIAKVLGVDLPKDVSKLNAQSTNFLYLAISHDENLYKMLENSRKKRNKIVHRLVEIGNIKLINKLAIECTLAHLELQQEIIKRFDGKILIPSINLYRNGWNDAKDETIKHLKNIKFGIDKINHEN